MRYDNILYTIEKRIEQMKKNLPKGHTIIGDIYGEWQAPACTCGADKVYGPNCPKEYHSSYCDKAAK